MSDCWFSDKDSMSNAVNPFAGLRNANIFETGQYLAADGRYLLQIEKIILKETRKSGKGFIVECTVVETSNEEKDPVGAKRSWFQSMKDLDVAFPAIKAFLYAALGYDYSKKEDKEYLKAKVEPIIDTVTFQACDETRNPFKGRKVGVETTAKVTKEKKQNFTRHDFFPADSKISFEQPPAAT